MQATVSPVIWQDYNHHSVAKDLFDALEAAFGKVGRHWPTSSWSTWWKFNLPIWQICCPKYNSFKTIIIVSCWMATADFLKTWWPSCFAQVFLNHMNRPPGNTSITSWWYAKDATKIYRARDLSINPMGLWGCDLGAMDCLQVWCRVKTVGLQDSVMQCKISARRCKA